MIVRAFALSFGVLVFVSIPALAHGKLKKSLPVNGAHLSEPPRELRLTFVERPELKYTAVELRNAQGQIVELSPLEQDSSGERLTVVAKIKGAMQKGVYTVYWKLLGRDGHPVDGKYYFTVVSVPNPPVGGASPLSARNDHHDPITMPAGINGFDAESPAYIVVRWLQFTALLLVIGAVAFRYVVLGRMKRKHGANVSLLNAMSVRAARIGLFGTVALAVTLVLRLYAQSYALHGAADALRIGLLASVVTGTAWGTGWLLQLMGIMIALAGFALVLRQYKVHHEESWIVPASGTVLLAFTPAFSGHALSVPDISALAILADGMHVMGAGGWLGSLLLVVAVGIPAALSLESDVRGAAVADLVNAFSPTALIFAGIVVTTGIFSAWLHLGTVDALWQSRYGQILLIKLGVLSIAMGTGAYNWLRVRPALGSTISGVTGASRIQRSATLELVIGALVLAVTAILVATPTAMDM